MEDVLIPISLFLAIFGILYVYLSTRNRERLALIEKGADASIFMRGRNEGIPLWKVIVLNLAFLLMGIGVGIFIGLLLSTYTIMDNDVIYPAIIFLMAGIGLYTGFRMSQKLDKN